MALQTYRETGESWEAADSDLKTEFLATAEDIQKQMAKLEAQLEKERKAWKAEMARNNTRRIIWIVIAGGLGYAIGGK